MRFLFSAETCPGEGRRSRGRGTAGMPERTFRGERLQCRAAVSNMAACST